MYTYIPRLRYFSLKQNVEPGGQVSHESVWVTTVTKMLQAWKIAIASTFVNFILEGLVVSNLGEMDNVDGCPEVVLRKIIDFWVICGLMGRGIMGGDFESWRPYLWSFPSGAAAVWGNSYLYTNRKKRGETVRKRVPQSFDEFAFDNKATISPSWIQFRAWSTVLPRRCDVKNKTRQLINFKNQTATLNTKVMKWNDPVWWGRSDNSPFWP